MNWYMYINWHLVNTSAKYGLTLGQELVECCLSIGQVLIECQSGICQMSVKYWLSIQNVSLYLTDVQLTLDWYSTDTQPTVGQYSEYAYLAELSTDWWSIYQLILSTDTTYSKHDPKRRENTVQSNSHWTGNQRKDKESTQQLWSLSIMLD